MVTRFSELIDQWPTMTELATDLGEKPETVRKWRQREQIPANRWRLLLTAAQDREIEVSESTLIRLAEKAAA